MAQENQARRLLNDLARYRAELDRTAAGRCRRRSPSTAGSRRSSSLRSPPSRAELWGKRDAAEVFHEALEHRWFLSSRPARTSA